jgi:origin recognition complex subunit 5
MPPPHPRKVCRHCVSFLNNELTCIPEIISRLTLLYPSTPPPPTLLVPAGTYAPTLRSLHTQYCATLYTVLSPFLQDPDELAYIAAARWPGFVQPLLDEHARILVERAAEHAAEGLDTDDNVEAEEDAWPEAPSEETRVRLLRHFSASFTQALDVLYPRHMDATRWAMLAAGEDTSVPPAESAGGETDGTALVKALPRMQAFVLLAAWIASTNPAKSDIRTFGRLSDGRGRGGRGGANKV